jgi:hypothetical protein
MSGISHREHREHRDILSNNNEFFKRRNSIEFEEKSDRIEMYFYFEVENQGMAKKS